jgi:hypothetical protein
MSYFQIFSDLVPGRSLIVAASLNPAGDVNSDLASARAKFQEANPKVAVASISKLGVSWATANPTVLFQISATGTTGQPATPYQIASQQNQAGDVNSDLDAALELLMANAPGVVVLSVKRVKIDIL